jgi:general secretion pathway protein C
MNLATTFNQVRGADFEAVLGRASKSLPKWVAGLLVVIIAWQLARLIWLLVPAPADELPPATGSGQAAPLPDTLVDVTSIVEAHFFGEADAQENVLATPVEDLPESNAALSLRGTIASDKAGQAIAIIADSSGEEKVYKVDAALPGGFSLHSVQRDRVILNRSGRLEALLLPRETAASTAQTYTPPVTAPPVAAPPPQPSVRELVTENAASLTEIIRPQPVFADGKQRGYRIYPGRKRQQFAELGLKPGDLVTAINGTALDDPASGMEVFRTLGESDQVSVTVERNGQPETLTLDTSQLGAAGGDEGVEH